jgi:hypothetical protein
MRFARLPIAALVAGWLVPSMARGVDYTPAPTAVPAATSDDRIVLSADGSTLPGTNGGGGGSIGWLHNFDADTLAGVAVEHQVISVAQWTFASVNGSVTRAFGNARYGFYGEAHEGAGDDGPHAFKYSIVAAGVVGTYFHRLSVQLDDRQYEVEKTHGNLPKLGLSYQWNPRVLTTVSYAHSVSGNLGTHLTAGRIDLFGSKVSFLGGVAFGQVSPTVLGLELVIPGKTLSEGYVGVTKPLPSLRGDLTLVVDYQDLSGSSRVAVILNYIFHVGHQGQPK